MASVPKISNSINGYSRYDIPENVGFSATPGLLYVARCDFMNARDVRYIQCGAVVRANPMLVPTFTPFQVRLHRFFCPISLYHPEMRVNSSGFDMRNSSTNVYSISNVGVPGQLINPLQGDSYGRFDPRSLLVQLGLSSGLMPAQVAGLYGIPTTDTYDVGTVLNLGGHYVNADPLIAYWDIVRNYYAYSQTKQFSWAYPIEGLASDNHSRNYFVPRAGATSSAESDNALASFGGGLWRQFFCNVEVLDEYYETSFYPKNSDKSKYRNANTLALALINSIRTDTYSMSSFVNTYLSNVNGTMSYAWYVSRSFPTAVVPSSPDRFSRSLPTSVSTSVGILNLQTITDLAIAARLSKYKELLGAGGSRFTDWLRTFFGAHVRHIDRPVLCYSSSFYLNSSPIFSQAATERAALGQFGGVLQGQDSFGKKAQRYYFEEPGYLMDLVSIRPLYYWSGIQADYARYDGSDYFNPLFNEIGYQTIPAIALGSTNSNLSGEQASILKEPCFNEFRASYDRVFGSFMAIPGLAADLQPNKLYNSWVMQRGQFTTGGSAVGSPTAAIQAIAMSKFVTIEDVNRPFASDSEDNFFVNLYYRVTSKSLVSKNFATNLATR